MKRIALILLFSSFSLLSTGQKAIFLHHSTGAGVYNEGDVPEWIYNYNLAHNTDYKIFERDYPSTPYSWDNDPYDYWNLWINGACNNDYPYIECLDKLSLEFDLIIFKHCFPSADLLPPDGNPSANTRIKTIENYKLQYRALRNIMDNYPDTKFMLWTLVPKHRLSTTSEQAALARQFVEWVKTSFLSEDGKKHPNIYIFDFFGLAAENNVNPEYGQYNCLKYDYEVSHTSNDSHPNTLANETIGPLFAEFIVNTLKDSISSDVNPPEVPTGLRVSSESIDSISISWDPSTDNVGIAAYRIFRDGNFLSNSAVSEYTDKSVSPGNSYSYSVSAIDKAGNESSQSASVMASAKDTEAPSTPSGLEVTSASVNNISLSWNAASDNVAVTTYNIYRNETLIQSVSSLAYSDTTVSPGNIYSYSVSAIDAAGNESARSEPVSTNTTDQEAPSSPENLRVTVSSVSTISLAWDASSDNIAVTQYIIYRDGNQIGRTNATEYSDNEVIVGQTYSYTVSAEDEAGNESLQSAPVVVQDNDTEAPSIPENLQLLSVSDQNISFSWDPSSDNVGVAFYNIYRSESLLVNTPDLEYSDNSIEPGNYYSYIVSAVDSAGNESNYSNELMVLAPTLVEYFQSDSELKLFPNPSWGNFRIILKNAGSDNYIMKIISLQGKLIYHDQVQFSENKVSVSVEMVKGMYILMICGKEKTHTTLLNIRN